jgi:hypothetical protein
MKRVVVRVYNRGCFRILSNALLVGLRVQLTMPRLSVLCGAVPTDVRVLDSGCGRFVDAFTLGASEAKSGPVGCEARASPCSVSVEAGGVVLGRLCIGSTAVLLGFRVAYCPPSICARLRAVGKLLNTGVRDRTADATPAERRDVTLP